MLFVVNLDVVIESDNEDGVLTDNFFHQVSLHRGHWPILEGLKKFKYTGPRNFSWKNSSEFFGVGTVEGVERRRVLETMAVTLMERDEGLMNEHTMW